MQTSRFPWHWSKLRYVDTPHFPLIVPSSNRRQLYDPIYTDAMQAHNISLNTIYQSRGLQLIGVSWSWAVALKLVRYQKDDPQDIAAILKLGTQFKGLHWTRRILEEWLLSMCSPMGYSRYSQKEIAATRQKMQDAIQRAQALTWPSQVPTLSQHSTVQSSMVLERPTTTRPQSHYIAHAALRARTKSLSQLPSRSAPRLPASSSMPHLTSQPARQSHAAMSATPSRPTSGHSHPPPQVSMVPVPVNQLPPGFIPYYVSPPHQTLHHRPPVSQRVRLA